MKTLRGLWPLDRQISLVTPSTNLASPEVSLSGFFLPSLITAFGLFSFKRYCMVKVDEGDVGSPAGSRWMAMDHTLDLIEHFVVVTAENEDSSAAGPEACVTDPTIFCCSFEPLDPSALLSTAVEEDKVVSCRLVQ